MPERAFDCVDLLGVVFLVMVAFCVHHTASQTLVGLWSPGDTDSPWSTIAQFSISIPFNFSAPPVGSIDISGIGVWLYSMTSLVSSTGGWANSSNVFTSSTQGMQVITPTGGVPGFDGEVVVHGVGSYPSDIVGGGGWPAVDHRCATSWYGAATSTTWFVDVNWLPSCLDKFVSLTVPQTFTAGGLVFNNPCHSTDFVCSPTMVPGANLVFSAGSGYCYRPAFFWNNVTDVFARACGLRFHSTPPIARFASRSVLSIRGGVPFIGDSQVTSFYHVRYCTGPNATGCSYEFAEALVPPGVPSLVHLDNPHESMDLLLELLDTTPQRRRRCFCFISCFGFGSCGGSGASKASVQKAVDQLTNEINTVQSELHSTIDVLASGLATQSDALSALSASQSAIASNLQGLAAYTYNNTIALESQIAAIQVGVEGLQSETTAGAQNAELRDGVTRSQFSFVESAIAGLMRDVYRLTLASVDQTGSLSPLFGPDWKSTLARAVSHLGYLPVDFSNPLAGVSTSFSNDGANVTLYLRVAPVGAVYHVDRFVPITTLPVQFVGNDTLFTPCEFAISTAFRVVAPVNYTVDDRALFVNYTPANASAPRAAAGVFVRSCPLCGATPAADTGSHTIALLSPPEVRCSAVGTFRSTQTFSTQFGKDVTVSATPTQLSVSLTASQAAGATVLLVDNDFSDIGRDLTTSQLLDHFDVDDAPVTVDNFTSFRPLPPPAATYTDAVSQASAAVDVAVRENQDLQTQLDALRNETAKNFSSPEIKGTSCENEIAGICFDEVEHILIIIGGIIALVVVLALLYSCAKRSGACAVRARAESRQHSSSQVPLTPGWRAPDSNPSSGRRSESNV